MEFTTLDKVITCNLNHFLVETPVEKTYSDKGEFYGMFSALAIFVFLKWVVNLNFELSIVMTIGSITLWDSLLDNSFRFVFFFFLMEILLCVYYYEIGPYLAVKFQIELLDPLNIKDVSWIMRCLHSICWFGISIVLLIVFGILFFFPSFFLPEQMPRSLHCFAVWMLLSLGQTAYYFFVYAFLWLLLAFWLLDALHMPLFLLAAAIIFVIVLCIKHTEAVNISWDLYAFRNQVLLRFNEDYSLQNEALWESTYDAFGSTGDQDSFEVIKKRISSWVTLVHSYANRKGIMRNAQQCIRWCNAIINYGETNSIANSYLSTIGNINLQWAHMFLYVIYSRSTEYKSETEAKKHYQQFNHDEISVSEYWPDWDDPNCPFEDGSATRFEGIDFLSLKKIARKEPDAYLTLHHVCERFGRFWGVYNKNNLEPEIYEKYIELAQHFLDRGIEEGSRACIEYVKEKSNNAQ